MIMEEKKLVGTIEHYFAKAGVAVVNLEGELSIGDKISIEGMTTNLQQAVESMQIDHEPVEPAKPGDDIGLKVSDKVRPGDQVYKIIG